MFYTDWYDYPDADTFYKLPETIKSDAQFFASTQGRPTSTDISLMLHHLAEVYSGKAGIMSNLEAIVTIRKTLIELAEAARKNKVYKDALLGDSRDDIFTRYCALFLFVCNDDEDKLKFLQNLCKEWAPNLKFTDVISAQSLMLGTRRADMERAAMIIKQNRDGRK